MAHGLRALLEKAVVRRKMTLKALIEVDSYRAQISLMEEGIGYTLLPASAIRVELAAKRLEMAVLVNPTITRELVLGSPVATPPTIATTAVSTVIMSEIEQMSGQGYWKSRCPVREHGIPPKSSRSKPIAAVPTSIKLRNLVERFNSRAVGSRRGTTSSPRNNLAFVLLASIRGGLIGDFDKGSRPRSAFHILRHRLADCETTSSCVGTLCES
jgi:hypothetical protein